MNWNNKLLTALLVFLILIVGLSALGCLESNDVHDIEASEDTENSIKGIITFDSEESLTNATAYIKIEDVSLADAPSTVVSQITLEDISIDNGSSIPFEISYSELQEGHTYSLSAHMDVDGDGSVSGGDYLTTQHVEVPVSGTEETIEVPVEFIEGYSGNNGESETLSSFNGTISSIENADPYPMILVESEEMDEAGYDSGIKFVLSEETYIQDPTGGLYDVDNLQEGMEVRVFFGPELTRSNPPVGQAKLVQLI
ncbi:YbaY family lipoprotein [Methanolobus sp. ZRKC2]|uniref:YbaY family lipoprotein n=1 Tax=Methanolobus sp. ZRKC2 TaxID=3125783 RepID=UPI0032450FFF